MKTETLLLLIAYILLFLSELPLFDNMQLKQFAIVMMIVMLPAYAIMKAMEGFYNFENNINNMSFPVIKEQRKKRVKNKPLTTVFDYKKKDFK